MSLGLAAPAALLLALVAAPILIAARIRASIERLRSARLPELDPQGQECARLVRSVVGQGTWADRAGYRWLGAYRAGRHPMAVWVNEERSTVFCATLHPLGAVHEFVTGWDGGRGLTTSSSRNVFSLPRPDGVLVQAFEWLTLDELHRRHTDGVVFAARRFGSDPQLPDAGGAEHLRKTARQHGEFVGSIPWYPIRSLAWHVRRGQRVGRPVEDLAA